MVVPTYNECDRLGTLLEQVFETCRDCGLRVRVVVVDDNSADGTGAIADEWAGRANVQVIHRPGKLGLGSAVLEGFAIAETDVVGVMDADLSHPAALIPALYSAIASSNLDMVVASRYVASGGTRAWSFGRFLLSRVGCWLSLPLTPVRDPMSGFFLIRRERATGFQASTRGFKIGLELLVRAHPRRVAEVGYIFVNREAGESKMSWGEGLRFLRQLVRLYAYSCSGASMRPALVTLANGSASPDTPLVRA